MPEKIRRYTASLFLLALIPPIAVASSFNDIRILSSDQTGISFELTIGNPNQYIASLPGDTEFIAVKTVVIGLPQDAIPFIINADAVEMTNEQFIHPGTVESSSTLAKIVEIRKIRGRKLATINIFPYYGGALYKKISVSLRFEFPENQLDRPLALSKDDLFESIFENTILNYDQFKMWPVATPIKSARVAQSPFSTGREWYKIKTTDEGLARVTGLNLTAAGISINGLRSDSLHLYYGGGEPIPDDNFTQVNPFEEISILVEDNGDGTFGRDDYFIFFAEGADRWRYPNVSSPDYLENHYTDANYYWLAVSGDFPAGGKRIGTIDGTPSGSADTVITTGRFNRFISQNKMLAYDGNQRINDYFNWYWTDQAHYSFYESLPNAITGEKAEVTIRAISNPTNYIIINSFMASSVGANRPLYFFETERLRPGLNGFSLILDSSTTTPPYFDYCEISYIGDLTPTGDVLDFSTGGFYGTGEISINNQFSGVPLILDISDSKNPIRITGTLVTTDEITFNYDLSAVSRNRFIVSPAAEAFPPDEIEKAAIDDLRESRPQTDMFVIAPEQFLPLLEEYELYREEKSDIAVTTVSLERIMDQFSYGMYDPKAIREFLKFSYENYPDPAPAAVLLIGDGNFDFENNLGFSSVNLMPPCIQEIDSSASDDNYVFFGEYGLLDSDTSYAVDRGYDMMISRWPVKTESELATVIEKVKMYEASANYGPWRSTITLVADDEFGHYDTEWFHTSQTEELQQPPRLPSSFRRNKIYIWDYPFNSIGKKPLANEAIIRSFNEGSLLINYVGHGNPDSWAHETVFDRNTDLIHLNNADRLPLVLTASCSIGFFDDPGREGMGEELFRLSTGGAIGVISATRLVYSSDNAAFNQEIFEKLFENNNLTMAQVFYAAKLSRQYLAGYPQAIRNDRNYAYFGDPFIKLGIPQYDIKFLDRPDSLIVMESRHASGEMVDKSTGQRIDFDGELEIFVYDSNIEKKHKVVDEDGDSVKTVSYSMNGPAIYRGTAAIMDGFFDFSFITPLDVGLGGRTAKISGYGISSSSDALGLADSLPVSLKIALPEDINGPGIVYTFGDRIGFVSGDRITPGETMTLTISDSSGVNLTGSLGHEISLVIDGMVENMANLTDLFQYNTGSYVAGRIEYDIGPLSSGFHSFKVKAWDNANNSSLVEFSAEVLDEGQFMVMDLLNYPNPMRESTTFSLSLSSPASDVNLEVFTLSGRKIKSVGLGPVRAGYNEIYCWDGRDADADRIGSGVYIYKVTAVSEWYGKTVESFGKVVLIN